MLINNSTGIITSLLTIDTTVAAPHNTATNVLVITGTGGIVVPNGTTGQQPTHAAGLLRYNTTNTNYEFSTGSVWATLARFTDIADTITSSYVRTTLGLDSVYLQSANLNAGIDAHVDATFIGGLVDSRYVNVSGDTMTGDLTLAGNPTVALHATTKSYVDALVSSGATWRNPVKDPDLTDVVTAIPGSPVSGTGFIKFGGTQNETWGAVTNVVDNDILYFLTGVWYRIGTLVAGDRFLINAEHGTIGAGLSGVGFVDDDLIQYVSGNPGLFASWTLPEGRGQGGTGTEITKGITVLVSNNLSKHYGHSYMYNDVADHWTEISGPGAIDAGVGLSYSGNILNLDIPVLTTDGGTGLTSIGTSNQVLGVINAGGSLEYKSIVGTASQIGVTHTANTITITNLGILSVASSTGTTGLTLTATTTTGAVTQVLAGTLAIANGGTGLTSLGTSNQVLGVNNAGTAAEYKTITAGTAVSVVDTANTITINNTGVTSNIAGTGISVSGATGAVTISNTGVTNITLSTVSPVGGGANVSGVLINGTEGTTTLSTGSVSTTGTITVALNSALQSLANPPSSGVMTAGSGTYTSRVMTGTTGQIVVTDGDGVAGNPTWSLATAGTAVSNVFDKFTTDAYGRITATTAVSQGDITGVVGTYYIPSTGGTVTGSLTFTSGTVTGLATPTASTDAATKGYVDLAMQGLTPKQVVRAATIAPGTLATSFANGSVVDGITLATNDRILIKNQATQSENGIYTVNATGAPTRATDNDTWSEVVNAYVFVSVGSLADTGWVCTSDAGGTVGSTSMVFVQFAGAGTYTAGTGLTLTGTTFSITAPVAITLGGTGLTSAPSAEQLLVGTAGGAYALSTLTAGSGIGITNSAGVLTIANSGILSVASSVTNAAGLTLTSTTTTGAVAQEIGGTLTVANGGTGLTAAGTSGQLLGVSATTGVLEYKTLTAGTGIVIDSTTTPGVVTVSSAGGSVTSVALAAPSIFTVSGSPITSSGTLTFSLNTQVKNLVFAGPSTGADAAPTFRALAYSDLPIVLFTENPSTPATNTASGANAVAIGSGASATGAGSIALGTGSSAGQAGGVAIANGGTAGTAQTGIYALRNTSTSATAVDLFLDGSTTQIVLANNSMMTFTVTIAALGTTDQAAYKIEGGIFRGANAASTTVFGSQSTTLAETTGAIPWDATVIADTTNGAIQVQVTGAAATTIKWVATVVTTEVQ